MLILGNMGTARPGNSLLGPPCKTSHSPCICLGLTQALHTLILNSLNFIEIVYEVTSSGYHPHLLSSLQREVRAEVGLFCT